MSFLIFGTYRLDQVCNTLIYHTLQNTGLFRFKHSHLRVIDTSSLKKQNKTKTKQTNKQTKQTNKQTNKHTNKQTNKQNQHYTTLWQLFSAMNVQEPRFVLLINCILPHVCNHRSKSRLLLTNYNLFMICQGKKNRTKQKQKQKGKII